jgi:hypothetical protein
MKLAVLDFTSGLIDTLRFTDNNHLRLLGY